MSAKTVFSAALVLPLLSFCAAHGQNTTLPLPGRDASPYAAPPTVQPGGPPVPHPEGGLPPGPTPNGPAGLSNWITGTRANCCGPVGGDGPICSELYFRLGAAINLGRVSPLNDVIHSGYMVSGGYRSLFFNPERTNAWTVEFGISNTTNQGKFNNAGGIPMNLLVLDANGTPTPVRFGVDRPGLTLRNLNRTAVNLGGGHEWYITDAANGCSPTWRAGFDIGGRWGSENAEFNEIRHRSKVFEGVWVALHTDVEVPCHCCTFVAGFRMEWDYTFSELFQTNTDLTGINLLVNLGVRY